jgi:serine/threonine protein kinase
VAWPELLLFTTQMLEALAALHSRGILHSDLKPANFVFVDGLLKLIDFGIARALSNDTTNIVRDGTVGTLNYMSPEAIADVSAAPGAGGCCRPRWASTACGSATAASTACRR